MIGLLGLGSNTTAYYIQEMNRQYQQINGGYSTCPFKMLNTNFDEINPFLPDQFERLIPITASYLEALHEMAVDRIIVPNITLHETIEKILGGKTIYNKLIHPIDTTVNAIKSKQLKKVYLFGSKYTMGNQYMVEKFEAANIDIIAPAKQDQEKIDLIRRHIYENGQTNIAIEQIESLAGKYNDHPIVLACTELSILRETIPQSIDMVHIQISEALSFYST